MSLTQQVITVVAVLIAGLIVGALTVAVAARQRQLDEQLTAARAFQDLLTFAERYAGPEHRAALRREAARIWDTFDPIARDLAAMSGTPERCPEYVDRLLDAYATGDPVDLSDCWVPAHVRGRLRGILAAASEATTPMTTWSAGGPITRPEPVQLNRQDLPLVRARDAS